MTKTEATASSHLGRYGLDSTATCTDRAAGAPGSVLHSSRSLDEVLGIDMIAIGFPIDRPPMEVFNRDRTDHIRDGRVRRTAVIRFEAGTMGVLLHIRATADGWRGYLRFNPARHALNAEAWRGLPTRDLPEVMAEAWRAAHDFVRPRVVLGEASVRRIDIALDFEVSEVAKSCLLNGLLKVKVPHATRRSMHTTRRGTPQTLYASTSGEGGVRVYDHHVAHGTSPVGTLRVEVEAHGRWADRYGGVEAVADISPTSVTDLFMNRWNWAGIGTPVLFEHDRTERIWSLAHDPASAITPLQAIRLLGAERLVEAGITMPEGNSTRSARNALRAAVGVAHNDHGAPLRICLDPAHAEPRTIAA